MEDKVTMERKFGELTLDELKKAYEACTSDFMNCDAKCPLYGSRRERLCVKVMQNSVLELIDAYETTLTLSEHWFKRANALSGKADKYDSVRNELIRTQELLKNSQDECRKRAEKIKALREEMDYLRNELTNVHDMRDDLNCKLRYAEETRKKLEDENKDLKDDLERRKSVIGQLLKEKDETCEAMFHYRVIKNSLRTIGKAIFNDESGNHEKD